MFETSEKLILRGSDIVALLASIAVVACVLTFIITAMVTIAPQGARYRFRSAVKQ